MVDRRDLGSWLDGPGGVTPVQDFPGQRLGRPRDGDGSVGRPGRRVGGLIVDWTIAVVIARAMFGPDASFAPLGIFLLEHLLLVGTVGATIGHRVFGLRVETLQGAHAGPVPAVIRSLLLVLVIPPLVMDADHRGLHDRAAGTIVARR